MWGAFSSFETEICLFLNDGEDQEQYVDDGGALVLQFLRGANA